MSFLLHFLATPPPNSAHFRRLRHLCLLFPLFFFFLFFLSAAASELDALLAIKAAFDSPPDLSTWILTTTTIHGVGAPPPPPYCTSWRGVACSNINGSRSSAASSNATFSVTSLTLRGCFLGGTLSPAISLLPHLSLLDLSNNSISGTIPPEITSLPQLRLLDLSYNGFSGGVPPDWGSLASLQRARLQNNKLEGDIPEGVFAAPALRRIELGHNRLSGALPRRILGANARIMAISVEYNFLSGAIPPELALVSSLRSFYAANNSFTGSLPESIGNLTKLRNLQLQYNHLQSTIPASWANLATTLTTFNVSGNNLSGEVPQQLLQQFDASAFASNAGLCSPLAGVLPLCPTSHAVPPPTPSLSPPSSGRSKIHLHPEIIVGAAMAIVIVILIVLLCVVCRRAETRGSGTTNVVAAAAEAPTPREEAVEERWTGALVRKPGRFAVFDAGIAKYSYEQLVSAAGFYDTAHVVGKGKYATVYRSDIRLPEGAKLAVKVFKYPIAVASFEAEMETLTLLKHTHLLPIKAYFCDTAEKAIIYDYMPAGSLHSLLHGASDNHSPRLSGSLKPAPLPPPDWSARQRIASGTAHALDYLHRSSLVHKDVQSSNILLDSVDLSPRLADFGLLQLVSDRGPEEVVEKPGYTAPEVAEGRRRYSDKSDVYSFGVVLLELLTGRRAVVAVGAGAEAEAEAEAKKLSEWAAEMWEKGRGREAMDGLAWKTCPFPEYLDTAMKVALQCVREDPSARPTMYEVASVLEGLASNPSPLKTPDLFSP